MTTTCEKAENPSETEISAVACVSCGQEVAGAGAQWHGDEHSNISETNNIKQLKLGRLDKTSEIRTMPPPSLLLASLLLLVANPGVLGFHLPGTSSTSCSAPGHTPGACVQITECPSIGNIYI